MQTQISLNPLLDTYSSCIYITNFRWDVEYRSWQMVLYVCQVKKQATVASSTTEVEYNIALSEAVQEAL